MIEIRINTLIWEDWNVAHLARHDVTPVEVEQICQGSHIVRQGKKGRLLVIGLTKQGRMITAALDPEEKEGVYYPVTARPASKKERRLYQEEQEKNKGGEEAA
jgi:uncharacterized DUF497 family protein